MSAAAAASWYTSTLVVIVTVMEWEPKLSTGNATLFELDQIHVSFNSSEDRHINLAIHIYRISISADKGVDRMEWVERKQSQFILVFSCIG